MTRIYEIELDGGYIITGGAIKLIDKMKGHSYFEDQLNRLGKLQNYLKIEQIVSKEGLDEDL